MKLIATQAFGPYAQGDAITDKAAIDTILASEQAAFVVRVPDDPAPVANGKNAAADAGDAK